MVVCSTLTAGDMMALLAYSMNTVTNLMMLSRVQVMISVSTSICKTNQCGIQ
jgi:hypothetical protein